ncbi:hypothetical protein ACWGR4_30195 [Embleya sp. NPDC055664]
MADSEWTHVVRGEVVTLPGTLGGIRAALPEERRAEFDKVVYDTPLDELVRRVVLDWALPPEAHEEAEEAMERVRRGYYTGVVDADGNPVTGPPAE